MAYTECAENKTKESPRGGPAAPFQSGISVAHARTLRQNDGMLRVSLSVVLVLLAGCSPEGDKPAKAPGEPAPAPALPEKSGAPAATPAPSAAITADEAAGQAETAAAVPYKSLGWDSEKALLLLDGKPFTGVTADRYKPTGKLKSRYHVKDGVYHGLVEEWYDNGNQKTKTSYVMKKHEGDNFYWNSDGTLQVHKVWKDDNLVSETPGGKH